MATHKMNLGKCVTCDKTTSQIMEGGFAECGREVQKRPKPSKIKTHSKKLHLVADECFSLFIRSRDNWRCGKCGNKFKMSDILITAGRPLGILIHNDSWGESKHLHNSHYHNRSTSPRLYFDERNCMTLCGNMYKAGGKYHRTGCHAWAEGTAEGREWYKSEMIVRLGQNEFGLLEVLARETGNYQRNYMAVIIESIVHLRDLGYDVTELKAKHKLEEWVK